MQGVYHRLRKRGPLTTEELPLKEEHGKGRYNIKVPGQYLWETTASSLGCSETTSNYLNVEEEYKVYIQCTSQTSAYALRSWYKKLGGVDYAGHIKPEANNKHKVMAHIILYACSLTRALYLDPVKSLQTTEFLLSLKGMVARRGRASTIFSDNGSMFIGAAAWSKQVQTDENLNDLLMVQQIMWSFNLSSSAW